MANSNGSNGRARGLVVPIGTVLGIAGTVLLAMLGYASQQFNNLRSEFDQDRLLARREYHADVEKLRLEARAELIALRKEFREVMKREFARIERSDIQQLDARSNSYNRRDHHDDRGDIPMLTRAVLLRRTPGRHSGDCPGAMRPSRPGWCVVAQRQQQRGLERVFNRDRWRGCL